MLGPGRYLLGVADLALLAGFAYLGASTLRSSLLPRLSGAPACLATAVLGLALLLLSAETLGTFRALDPLPLLALVGALGVGLRPLLPRVAWGRGSPAARSPAGRAPWGMPPRQDPRAGAPLVPTLIALAIAAVALIHFAAGAKT